VTYIAVSDFLYIGAYMYKARICWFDSLNAERTKTHLQFVDSVHTFFRITVWIQTHIRCNIDLKSCEAFAIYKQNLKQW